MDEHVAAAVEALVDTGLSRNRADAAARQVGLGREDRDEEPSARLEDPRRLAERAVPLGAAPLAVVDAERDDEVEGAVAEPREVVHAPDPHAPGRLVFAENRCDALPRPRDHRRRAVEGVHGEAPLGERHGIAPGGAADVEDAHASRIGKPAHDLHQAHVGLAGGEPLDVLR